MVRDGVLPRELPLPRGAPRQRGLVGARPVTGVRHAAGRRGCRGGGRGRGVKEALSSLSERPPSVPGMNATPATTKTDAETEPDGRRDQGRRPRPRPPRGGEAADERCPPRPPAPRGADATSPGRRRHARRRTCSTTTTRRRPAAASGRFGAGAPPSSPPRSARCRSAAPGWARRSPSARPSSARSRPRQSGTRRPADPGDLRRLLAHHRPGQRRLRAARADRRRRVLARPAFGAPGSAEQPVWVKAVALAGVVLGVLGLLISAASCTSTCSRAAQRKAEAPPLRRRLRHPSRALGGPGPHPAV